MRLLDCQHKKGDTAWKALKVLDSNSTGVIEYAEFLQWWKSHDRGAALQMSESELKQVEQATTYFQYFDKDRSGSIEKKGELSGCVGGYRASDTLPEFAQLHEDLVRLILAVGG